MGGMSKFSEPQVKFSQGTSVLKLTMMPSVDSIRSVVAQENIEEDMVDQKQETNQADKLTDQNQVVDGKIQVTKKVDLKKEVDDENQQQNNDDKISQFVNSPEPPFEQKNPINQKAQQNTEASVQKDADMRQKGVVCESRLAAEPLPRYPRGSRRRGEEGIVSIKVWIDEKGNPQKVEVIKSSGFPSLDRAAVEALRKGSFVPAMKNNKPVDSTLTQNIEFRLDK